MKKQDKKSNSANISIKQGAHYMPGTGRHGDSGKIYKQTKAQINEPVSGSCQQEVNSEEPVQTGIVLE